MKGDTPVAPRKDSCVWPEVTEALDDLNPSRRVAEIERRLELHAEAIRTLEAVRADALRQLQRERRSLSEIGRLIGATRQQVHRLLRTADDADFTGELLYSGAMTANGRSRSARKSDATAPITAWYESSEWNRLWMARRRRGPCLVCR